MLGKDKIIGLTPVIQIFKEGALDFIITISFCIKRSLPLGTVAMCKS